MILQDFIEKVENQLKPFKVKSYELEVYLYYDKELLQIASYQESGIPVHKTKITKVFD